MVERKRLSLSNANDIELLKELVKNLQSKVEALEKKNQELEARNRELEAENRELRSRADANSRNSHRPPSSEGLKKKPALPKQKNKARGGQKGHKGKTLEMVSQAEREVPCRPQVCPCGHPLADVIGRVVERRQVFELPEPKLDVIEFQRWICTCPQCHRQVSGEFPANVKAPVQYGGGVKAFTTLLSVQGCLSHDKIAQVFADLYGYQINEGTILSANEKAYEALEKPEQEIRKALAEEPTVNFDETGLRAEGKLHWMHTTSSGRFTNLYVHARRGKQALKSEYSILPQFRGWAIHDCWRSYFAFEDCKHAVCCAHLLRELLALEELKRKWAAAFRQYLFMLYRLTAQGRQTLVAGLRPWALRRYDELVAVAKAEEPPPEKIKGKRGKTKASKGYNLLRRLENYKSAVIAFAFHREVPFTNNQAERDLRATKVKQKMAGCFRTLQGARIYARIQGFISTIRKHQLNVFNELRAVFNGTPYSFALQPS